MKKVIVLLLMMAALAVTAHADVLISESFETDLSGGTGLGAWTTNNVDRWAHIWYTGDGTIQGTPDGDAFGAAQSGGFLRRENALGSAGISSAIDGSVDLVTPGTVYFSALIEPFNGDDTNHNAALILGTDVLDAPGGAPGGLMTAGEGIGFGLNGYTLHAYSYDGGVGTESAGSVAAANGSTLMIVGKITWGATDTLNLYNITDASAPLPAAFATVTGDLDESLFDTLAIADKRQTGIDEIRFGTELGDVIADVIAEPDWIAGGTNGSGSTIGTYTVDGSELMAFSFDNSSAGYSEIRHTVQDPDWTAGSPQALSLDFIGDPANPTDVPLYIALEDGSGHFASLEFGCYGESTDELTTGFGVWHTWHLKLQDFVNENPLLDLSDIQYLYIGFGDRDVPVPSPDAGLLWIDNIQLNPSQCVERFRPVADISGDCQVDLDDLLELAQNWLAL